MDTEKSYRILLNMVPGIGPIGYRLLLRRFETAEHVSRASYSELKSTVNEQLAQRIRHYADNKKELDKELKLIQDSGVNVLTWEDDSYPKVFRDLDTSPPVIYTKGDLSFFNHNAVIAVVGTRKPTGYGERVAADLTKKLAELGFFTASGFALGIDSIVHRVTLESGSKTAAVLGCGLMVEYPYANRDMKKRIEKNGILISEFPLSYPPMAENFPRRNRLIAALGLATLVIEADEKSGSLITVSEALNQGKEVFSVPGSVYSPYSRGTNKLITQGAKLVRCVEDILNELNVQLNLDFNSKNSIKEDSYRPDIDDILTKDEQNILDIIDWEGIDIEQICQKADVVSYELAKVLIDLELKGFVRTLPGKRYVRIKQ
ncbi:MAG: DNA-processing protein DprA [bacterium]